MNAPVKDPYELRNVVYFCEKYNNGATIKWKNFDDSFSCYDTIPQRDRQTYRRTAAYASCGKITCI